LAGGYVKDGVLRYEYNLFEIDRTHIVAKDKLPTGNVKIEVESRLAVPKPGAPLDVTLKVNGQVVAQGRVPITALSPSPPTTASISEATSARRCRKNISIGLVCLQREDHHHQDLVSEKIASACRSPIDGARPNPDKSPAFRRYASHL